MSIKFKLYILDIDYNIDSLTTSILFNALV